MINSFNTNIAVQFDVNISIFCQQLAQWTFYNLANRKNIHDGLCWSYNSLEAYTEIFPYWTRRQIESIINKCVNEGLVKKGNYNKSKYDRTTWYALTVDGLRFFPELSEEKYLQLLSETISPNCEMEFSERGNGNPQNVTPIPTNITTNNISKDIYRPSEEKCEKVKLKTAYELSNLVEDNPHDIPEQMLDDWLSIRKSKKARVTSTAWNLINKTLSQIQSQIGLSPIEVFETMVTNCWHSLKLEWFVKDKKQHTNGQRPNTDDTSWGKDFYVVNELGF